MGFLSKIFGSKPYKMETLDDYKEYNQVPVNFSKLYYSYPEKKVTFEGQKKEYYSFDKFIVDFPHLGYVGYDIKDSKQINISAGYFFEYRGYFYLGKSIEECLSKKIGFYINEKVFKPDPDNLKMFLLHKNYFDSLYSNTPCFIVELGEDMVVSTTSLSHRGIINARTKSFTNKFSTVSIGGVHNKPIIFDDKILLISIEDHFHKEYIPDEYKEHDVPYFGEIYYGYIIDYALFGSSKGIPITERLLRKENVVVDFLKYETIDIDNYLDSFTKQSRKRKLEKIMRINNEI